MQRSVAVETEKTDKGTETENLIENTPRRMSNYEKKASQNASVTTDEFARQIKAVIDPLAKQLAHLCELM